MKPEWSVSVVIPAFNADSWIGEALHTVLAQSYPHDQLEIIIVDDGSTDNTMTIASAVLATGDISWLTLTQRNFGPSRARNVGWQNARGKWIQFLDADDLLHPEKIAFQMKSEAGLSLDVAVVHSDWQRLQLVDGDWVPAGETVSPLIEGDPLAALLQAQYFVQLGSALYRRSWLEQVDGFDEQYWLIEDVDLMLRIAMAGGHFYRVTAGHPLFFYRQLERGSLSQRDRRAFVEGCVRNAALAEDYWRKQGDLTPEQTETLIGIYYQAARFFATADRERFTQLVTKLKSFRDPFIPAGPAHLRLASQLLGYPRAEELASQYRRLKRVFR